MTNTPQLPSIVADKVRQAQQGHLYNEIVFDSPELEVCKNEFLFFIKPEITLPSETINLDLVLTMVFEKLEEFHFNIHRIRIVSAEYLDKYDLIDQHYQVIADVSKHGIAAMNSKAKAKFQELYCVEPENVLVLGGVQFMERYPFFNDLSLDCLWQNSENFKLASGAYVEHLRVGREHVYLLNGFHPRQLRHFTEKGRSLVVFRVSGDLPWKDARELFAGATIPDKAKDGSLRHTLLERKEEFGIPEVAQSYNGIHLSAGPIEALVELKRFDSDFSDPSNHTEYTDFSFGKELMSLFGEIPQQLLQNAKIEIDGRRVSIFDLTEDTDSDKVLSLLPNYLG